MTATIKPADNSAELQSLVAEQMRKHNMRLRPGQTVATMIEAMQKDGLALKVEYGSLTGEISGQVAHLPHSFESFYTKHSDAFYPRDVSTGIRSRDQLDFKGKSEFISKFGLRAFEQLPRTAADADPLELDPATISREQYLRLPLKLKSECIRAWGSDAVSRIMARTK